MENRQESALRHEANVARTDARVDARSTRIRDLFDGYPGTEAPHGPCHVRFVDPDALIGA